MLGSTTFNAEERLEIESSLREAIEKHIDKYEDEVKDKRRNELILRIKIFIKLTEDDVKNLRSHGSNVIKLNWFASQLAERFNTMLGVKVTPTNGNSYSSILQICYECAKVVAPNTNIYRYAKAGIDLISVNNAGTYQMLSGKERSIVESIDNACKLKKRSITKKRKITMKHTLKVKKEC